MKYLRYAAVLSGFIFTPFAVAVTAAETYTFAVVPQSSAVQAAKEWTPILQAIETKTGLKFRFETTRDTATFAQRIAAETWDFVYMSPDQYANEDRPGSYAPIARARNLKLKSIVVVPQNSSAERLMDLDQKNIAIPVGTFSGDVVPRAILRNNGVSVAAVAMASQDLAYAEVLSGHTAAAGGTLRTFNALRQADRNQLRLLWTSEGYAPHAIAAHQRVPQDVMQRVQEALIDLHLDSPGKRMLKAIAPEGLDYAKDDDWNDIRELDVN